MVKLLEQTHGNKRSSLRRSRPSDVTVSCREVTGDQQDDRKVTVDIGATVQVVALGGPGGQCRTQREGPEGWFCHELLRATGHSERLSSSSARSVWELEGL